MQGRVGEDRHPHGGDGVEAPLLGELAHAHGVGQADVGGERWRRLERDLHRAGEVGPRLHGDGLTDDPEDAGPGLERAPELVVPAVVEGRQELVEEFGVGGTELHAVVPRLPGPRGHPAELLGQPVDLVGTQHVHRDTPERGPEQQRHGRDGEEWALAARRVRLVPGLHGVDAAVSELEEDGGVLGVDGLDHRRHAEHPLTRAHDRHAGRRATLVEDAGAALDDEAHAGAGVLDEVAGVDAGRVGPRAGSFEHGRPVQAVAHDGRADRQRRAQDIHVVHASA